MYQDEAGFSRISKLGSCWAPIGVGPHVHSHYIREFRYCYGAVDAILEDVINQLQDVIQGLEKEVIKSIVNRRWTRMLFENR
ncbi:transposase [Streptococcus pneumoniae]|nr:transposase [Streptococcus pneumoniae]